MNTQKRTGIDRPDWIIIGLTSGAGLILRLLPGPRIIDDAYITYRYTVNLLSGHGLVYNTGEAVLGTTTPLYTLLLALIGVISNSTAFPVISPILNAILDAAGIAALYIGGRELFGHKAPAAACAALWAFSPQSVTFAVGGMETSLAIGLLYFTLAAFIFRKYALASAGIALSILTRPDALIWAGPLGLAICVSKWFESRSEVIAKRLPLAEGAIFLTLVLPWVIFATLTYGSPIPHSISAKAVAYHLPPEQALIVLVQHYSTPFLEFSMFGPPGAIAGFVLYLPLCILGAMFLYRLDRRTVAITTYPWLFALVFAVANPLMFRWYTTPPLAVFNFCLVSGIWGLATRLRPTFAPAAILAVSLVWIGITLGSWRIHPDHGPDRPAPEMAWFKLEILYQRAAEDLKPLVKDNTVIASADIGAVGWYSGARVLDTLGLISPEATRFYPLDPAKIAGAAYAISPDLLIEQKPDYVIMLEVYGRSTVLKDARFARAYRLREKIPTDIYGSDGMLIFERVDEQR